jgi:hypothetical protein
MGPARGQDSRIEARCVTVEYFGSIRRYILERTDGAVLKLDQFGAEPGWLAAGETASIGWDSADAVLHDDPAAAHVLQPA